MSDDLSVRQQAIASLSGHHRQEALANLIDRLRHGGPDQERAVRAIAEIGEPAVEPLIRALSKPYARYAFWVRDGDFAMKFGAVKALGAIGDTRAISAMVSLFNLDELQHMAYDKWGRYAGGREKALCAQIADSIVRMGEPAARAMLDESRKSGYVNYVYNHALVELGKRGIITPTLDALRDPGLSRDAALVLGRVGDARAVPALVETLDESACSARYDVATALAQIDSERARTALQKFEGLHEKEIAFGMADYVAILRKPEGPSIQDTDLCLFLLARHGTPQMAEEFIGSRNPSLYVEAKLWLDRHGEHKGAAGSE